MTAFQLIIIPAIIVAAFLGWMGVLITRLVCHKIVLMNAQRRQAQAPIELLGVQAHVIYDVINELEINRLSYTAFPKELKEELIDAHGAWADSTGKRKITR